MKLRPTQFGARENTAAPGQHAPRLAVDSLPSIFETLPRGSQYGQPAPVLATRTSEHRESATTNPLQAATEGEGESATEGLPATAPVSTDNASRQAVKPLIGCEEAAKLLGNIHVKTLQRCARRGTVPGYRVAGHWYFRATELDAWLRSRINSSCHPCRSN